MPVPYYPGSLFTPNLGLALFGMDEVLAENFVLLDAATGGSSVEVNGSAITNPNFNDTTPAAPAGKTNVKWQADGSGNVSAYVPTAVPGGSDTQIQFNDANSFGGAATFTWNKTTSILGLTTQFAFNQTPIASLDPFLQSDAGAGAVWNSIVLKSAGVTTNNLRKALNIYYQGDMHQTAGDEYYGLQSSAYGILDGGSTSSRVASLGGQFGWKGSAPVPAGFQANGVMVQARATGAGTTGGQLTSFLSFNPQITAGATVSGLCGLYIDHAAMDTSKVTGFNIGISVYVGAGGWGLDLASGNGCGFGNKPLYHTSDAIINGGTLLDGWFSGTGTPQSAVTANVGSFYSRLDGGAGTSFYVKEVGTGNTGWVPVVTAATVAAGSNTQIQFNDGGAFGGAAGFVWSKTIPALALTNDATVSSVGKINGIVYATFGVATAPVAANGTSMFDVSTTSAATADITGFNAAMSVGYQVKYTSDDNGQNYAFLNGLMVPASSSHVLGETYSIGTVAANYGSGDVFSMEGVISFGQHSGSGTVDFVIGLDGEAFNTANGNSTDQAGVYAASHNEGTGIVTRNYGVWVDVPTLSSTTTHNYGIFVGDQTGGGANNPDPWAIYTDGGKVRIKGALVFAGSTSGSASVQVAAAAGSPNALQLPIATGTAGQALVTDGANPQQLSWSTITPVVATINQTGQTASIGTANIVASATATVYRLDYYLKITTAGSTSGSVTLTLSFTDRDDSQVITFVVPTPANAVDSTGVVSGVLVLDAKVATAITYATTYASVGGTPMAYKLRIKAEAL